MGPVGRNGLIRSRVCFFLQILFEADSIELALLELAQNKSPLMYVHGNLEYKCSHTRGRDTLTFQQDTLVVSPVVNSLTLSLSLSRLYSDICL